MVAAKQVASRIARIELDNAVEILERAILLTQTAKLHCAPSMRGREFCFRSRGMVDDGCAGGDDLLGGECSSAALRPIIRSRVMGSQQQGGGQQSGRPIAADARQDPALLKPHHDLAEILLQCVEPAISG
jgi:hypothetical protein